MCSVTDITYSIEEIPLGILENHLIETRDEFEMRGQGMLKRYAYKLSQNATFVTALNKDNCIIGLIAFYANRNPLAFISHVWVSKSYRGGGYLWQNVTMLDRLLS